MDEDDEIFAQGQVKSDRDENLGCLVAVLIAIFAFLMSNAWYTESGAIDELRAQYPSITRVHDIDRNVFAYSVFSVWEDGISRDMCLNTNILFDYEFEECPPEREFDYRDFY